MSTIDSPPDDRVRNSVLDAADVLFERYGYRKTTVEEIAQEAGIGKGSIYLHFKSKEEIALGWLKRLHSGVFTSLNAIVEDQSLTPAERIQKMLTHRVLVRFDIFDRHRKSMDEVMDSLQACIREKREAFHALEAEMISGLIDQGVANGSLISKEPLEDAYSMIIASSALCPYSLRPSQLGDRESVEKRAKNLASLLVRGIESRRAS